MFSIENQKVSMTHFHLWVFQVAQVPKRMTASCLRGRLALPGLLSLPHVRHRRLATIGRRRRLSRTARKRWVPSCPSTQPPRAVRAPSAAGSPLTSPARFSLLKRATALRQGPATAAGMSPSQTGHARCVLPNFLLGKPLLLAVPRKALRGGISKSILQRPCQFLAINAHKMAPRTSKGLQERAWDAWASVDSACPLSKVLETSTSL